MKLIPLKPVPSQTLTALLNGQNCKINVYQKSTGVYLDLFLNKNSIITAVMCRDRTRMVRQSYLGFSGDLIFADIEGNDDPTHLGFNTRFVLVYLEPLDIS